MSDDEEDYRIRAFTVCVTGFEKHWVDTKFGKM